MLTFSHSGCLGDLVYALPSVKNRVRDGKASLRLHPGVRDPDKVRLTSEQVDMLRPLLLAQPYIGEVDKESRRREDFEAQGITWVEPDYDLDRFRDVPFPTDRGDIGRYYAYAYPELIPDLSEPWIEVEPDLSMRDFVLINRTARYQNAKLDYSFITGRADVMFVGTAQEHASFQKQAKRIPHIWAEDFLQLARWIAGCKVFIGNQSFCWSLAEAMKTLRMVEVYAPCPNCVVHGANGVDFVDQDGFEWLFDALTT